MEPAKNKAQFRVKCTHLDALICKELPDMTMNFNHQQQNTWTVIDVTGKIPSVIMSDTKGLPVPQTDFLK